MTRLAAIIGGVVLGLSSVAGAQPRDHDRGQYDRDRTNEGSRRGDRRDWQRDNRWGWSNLGAVNMFGPYQKLMVGADSGRFSRLRIQATAGSPFIRRIEVRFVDDSLQQLDLRRRLRAGEVVDLDLATGYAKPISSITIIGRQDRFAQFTIMGR